MGLAGGPKQPCVVASLKTEALPPRHIAGHHWQELVEGSAIAPDLAALNFRSFGPGFASAEHERLELLRHRLELLNPQPGHSAWARRRAEQEYEHILEGGWRSVGGALPGFEAFTCWKPDQSRPKRERDAAGQWQVVPNRWIKYEHPAKASTGLLIPQVNERAWRLVAEHYGLEMPADRSQGFEQWLVATPEVPIVLVEGFKKAVCLLGLGFAAIALPGVWNGRRVPEVEGQKRKDLAFLIPELELLAVEGRSFVVAFDRDGKQSTADDVELAAVTLGHLLEKAQCNVGIAQIPELWWADKTGVDDVVAAGLADELVAALNDPLALAEVAWGGLYRRDRRKAPAIATSGRRLAEADELQQMPDAPLIGVRASKGAGKTELLSKWLKNEPRVIAITHRRSLGAALANRLDLQWRNDLSGYEGHTFNEATGEQWQGLPPRLALCVDSLLALGDPAQYEGAWLVVDEASQVLAHLLTSSTKNCQELRGALIQQFQGLLRHCKTVLLDADLADAELAWAEKAKGCQALLIDNPTRPVGWPVTWWEHSTPDAVQQALLAAVEAGERPFVVTDSREAATALNHLLEATTGRKGLLVTRTTVDQQEVAELLPRLNDEQAVAGLAWLVASPSISSGVSIEHSAFSSVWGVFVGGSLDDAEIAQALARVRQPVARHVWVSKASAAPHRISSAWWGSGVERDLRSRWSNEAMLLRRSLAPDLLSGTPLEVAEAFDSTVRLWATFTARRNYSHAHLRAFVLARLRHEGHAIERQAEPLADAEAKALRTLKSELATERAETRAQAICEAPVLGKSSAAALQQKQWRTPQEQAALQRRAICERLALQPEALTPALVQWGDRWASAAKRLLEVLEPDLALQADLEQLKATTAEGVLLPWDQGLRFERAKAAEAIGLKAFVLKVCQPGAEPWNKATPEVLELAKVARLHSQQVALAFGISVKRWPTDKQGKPLNDPQEAEQAVALVGKLLRCLGIVTVASRNGSDARSYRPDAAHLQVLLEAVARLRQKASALLHHPPFALKEQQVVEPLSPRTGKPDLEQTFLWPADSSPFVDSSSHLGDTSYPARLSQPYS